MIVRRPYGRWLPRLLILPALLYLLPIYLASLVILLVFTFFTFVPGGPLLNPSFTFANYQRLIDPLYGAILWRTLVISGIASVVSVVISYPVAYWFNRSQSRWRKIFLSLSILSLFVVPVVRVFSWTVVLGTRGFINETLRTLHLIADPLPLMYNEFGVTLVLVHYLLPLTTLTLAAALQQLDPTLELASANLGATKTRTFLSVTLPLSLPGIAAALSLAFAVNISTFSTPIIIGGGRVLLLANAVYDAMVVSYNLPLASAFSVVALVVALLVLGGLGRSLSRRLRVV